MSIKAAFSQVKIVLGAANTVTCAGILLNDGDTLSFGAYTLNAMTTPEHILCGR